LAELLADIFNDILKRRGDVPQQWKKTRLRVLFKKGDVRCPENYRPISILPILLKLFSRVLLGRISEVLGKAQSVDQAGFRPTFGCEDHLFTLTMLYEKSQEWGNAVWVAAIDFTKAFDTVEHTALWAALEEQGVPPQYIDVLRRLYEGQTGVVVAERESRSFDILRGTKQGDPISPPLFNSVLEKAMARVKKTWLQRGWGIQLGAGRDDRLLNLRFADDVLLVAKSLKILKKMMEDMRQEVAKVGLEMHFGKTKILANPKGRKQSHAPYVDIGNQRVEILGPDESTKYLGRAFALTDYHNREIKHRISYGWAKFMKYKDELCDRRISLEKRLKLFDSVVTPTVLYGSCCWTMTKEREHLLKVAERRMLRKIVQVARWRACGEAEEEPWVSYIVRSTRTAERISEIAGIANWVREQKRRKWRWGGHVARCMDRRWTQLVLHWVPDGRRGVGRPSLRWEDAFVDFFQKRGGETLSWFRHAQSRNAWRTLEAEFVHA
jgi:hypothetical protein